MVELHTDMLVSLMTLSFVVHFSNRLISNIQMLGTTLARKMRMHGLNLGVK